jgi:hypothetical protein
MFHYNVYHDDAEVYAGEELLDVGPSRTFRLREEGKWASVTLHEDGMVQGLFEDNGRVMEISPVSHQEPSVAALLLEDYEGDAPAHIIRWVAPPQLQGTRSSFLQEPEPTYPPDPTAPPEDGDTPVDTTGPGPIEEEALPEIAAMSSWGGVKWYPGCYKGDSAPHEFIMSFASDKAALDKLGDKNKLQAKLVSILNEASFVYEKQLNLKLKMGFLKMDLDGSEFGGCPSNDVRGRLGDVKNAVGSGHVKELAAAHIFTGCGGQWGVLGVAYVGTICGGAWATGANKIHGGSSPWLTFAHELGHTFAGKHSFEDGQGKTGGVMDYGNGKLNGHYQFNTKYRKQEMCNKMDSKVDRCNGNFQKDSGAPPTSPTTPGPTSPPSPTDKKCSFESRADLGCGMWMNAQGDNFDWTQKSGKTPSCGTGPSAASDGSQYIFIETSSPRRRRRRLRTGDKAKLQTKSAVKLGALSTLKFDYHMHGRSVGKLQVLVDSDVVFEKAGSQANGWHTETLKLDKYAGKSSTVAFVASRGTSWSGDIAIDNVHFDTGGGGSGGPTTLPPTTKKPEPEPEPTTEAPTTKKPEPEPEPTTEAPTTKKPEPEPEPTTAPPGGGGSLEKKVDALEKKADEILKILKGLVGSGGGSR